MTDQRERDRFAFALGYTICHGIKLHNQGVVNSDDLADSFAEAMISTKEKFPSITEAVLKDILENCSYQTIKPLLTEIIDRAKRA